MAKIGAAAEVERLRDEEGRLRAASGKLRAEIGELEVTRQRERTK